MKQLLVTAMLTLVVFGTSLAVAQDPGQKDGQPAKAKVGVLINEAKAYKGYTLIYPMNSNNTYLIDMEGRVVKTWKGAAAPAHSAYLLPNGNLLRPCKVEGKTAFGGTPGAGGRIQEFNWEGDVVWDYKLADDKMQQHHDVCKLPNGNALIVSWDKKNAVEAGAAGRKGSGPLHPDVILEVKPQGKTEGEIVWKWHIWDHLIQDNDSAKANYGNVADHPELVDVNFSEGFTAIAKGKDLDKLKGIGYIGGGGKATADWTHVNCIAYNADLDQIMLSIHGFSEFWIIDHSTTTAEAATHKGGKSGKGGDLLYRWGNPRAYRAGSAKDQQLFAQHNAHWIPKGYPGAGHVILFNNGTRRADGSYSTADEIAIPSPDANGVYPLAKGKAFGPEKALWSYAAPNKTDLYSLVISGAHRLPNGNTLICEGMSGVLWEVTPEKDLVWKFVNPSPPGKGGAGGPDPKKGGGDPKKADPGKGGPPGGGKGPGGLGGGSMFRATRIDPEYPALKGRDLTPGKTLEELYKDTKAK